MGIIINLELKRGPKTTEKLLDEVGDARVAVLVIRAWAKGKFGFNSPEYLLLNEQLKKQEISNKSSTEIFQAMQDDLSDDSIVGVRALRDLEATHARLATKLSNLAERIRVAREMGNIVSFTNYRMMKAYQTVEPPEAA